MTQPHVFARRLARPCGRPFPPGPPCDRALLLSCGLLRANRAVVLEPDWRHHGHRLGVVAGDGEALCFIAVVARSEEHRTAAPGQLVDGPLRIRLRAAAGEWLRSSGARTASCSLRFDLVSVTLGQRGSFDLRHRKGVA